MIEILFLMWALIATYYAWQYRKLLNQSLDTNDQLIKTTNEAIDLIDRITGR